MKQLYFLILIITIVACGGQQSEPITDKTQTIQPSSRSSYFVEQIKSNSIKRQTHYNIDSLDVEKLKPLDSIFFKTYFDGLAIDNIKDEKVIFDKWSRYYFFDYTEVNNLLFFSFIHDDEVGYDNVYHVTFDINSNKILSTDLIAATGGDGGHGNIDIFNYNIKGDSLLHRSLSTFDTDIEEGYTREYETVESKHIFGNFKSKYIVINSVTGVDTIFASN
ncbi:hypothetical protein [Pontibacter populi]|uniref:Lipoprotein n=1 Tax=Pontibacter populi TaxID=890055 RepID=A0ABV1RRN8_9BACT